MFLFPPQPCQGSLTFPPLTVQLSLSLTHALRHGAGIILGLYEPTLYDLQQHRLYRELVANFRKTKPACHNMTSEDEHSYVRSVLKGNVPFRKPA